jgi:cell shape-determining protein MreC
MVDATIKRNNMILDYKFNTMLDDAKQKVKKLESKIKDSQDNNTQNKDLNMISQELKNYEKVASTLIKRLETNKGNYDDYF